MTSHSHAQMLTLRFVNALLTTVSHLLRLHFTAHDLQALKHYVFPTSFILDKLIHLTRDFSYTFRTSFIGVKDYLDNHSLSTGVPMALQIMRPNCPDPSSVRTDRTQCSPDATMPIKYLMYFT